MSVEGWGLGLLLKYHSVKHHGTALKLPFDKRLRLEFYGARITSNAKTLRASNGAGL